MAINLDMQLNQFRSVMRGEVNGSIRFMILALSAVVVWIAVMWLGGMSASAVSSLNLQQERYNTLSQLAAEYRVIAPQKNAGNAGKMDAMTAFTQVSSQIELAERVSRIAPLPDGRLTVDVNRVYAEELADMIRELTGRGIRVLEAQIRALPAGDERLFSVTATLGPEA